MFDCDASDGLPHRQQIEQYFKRVTEQLDNCLNIKTMMATPLKSRAFAVSQKWVDSFIMYLENLQQFHQILSKCLQDDLREGAAKPLTNEDLKEYAGLYQVAESLKPWPIQNFDLVNLDHQYTN